MIIKVYNSENTECKNIFADTLETLFTKCNYLKLVNKKF